MIYYSLARLRPATVLAPSFFLVVFFVTVRFVEVEAGAFALLTCPGEGFCGAAAPAASEAPTLTVVPLELPLLLLRCRFSTDLRTQQKFNSISSRMNKKRNVRNFRDFFCSENQAQQKLIVIKTTINRVEA